MPLRDEPADAQRTPELPQLSFPYWLLDQTAAVRAALQFDVTGGEQDWDLVTWQRMINLPAPLSCSPT